VRKFAFILHPLQPKDLARKYPFVRFLPDFLIEKYSATASPKIASHITGIRSKTGEEIEGYFIGLPLIPRQMIKDIPLPVVYDKLAKCAQMASDLGAELIGLGAFTSVVGDGGRTVRSRTNIGVTTGNSYTVATAIDGTLKACALLGIDPGNSTLAVVGATGSIGRTCAEVLAKEFGRVILVGRDLERTEAIAAEIPGAIASSNVADIAHADAVVTVTSADTEIILPHHLRQGAIVCDVARPRDVSVRVAKERPDVLVIEGGVVRVPGDVEFNFEFGFPKKTAYACMSETMMLALEGDPGKYDFTLGKEVSVPQVEEMRLLALKHGFELAGFRSFERAVGKDSIDRAKKARLMAHSIPRDAAASLR